MEGAGRAYEADDVSQQREVEQMFDHRSQINQFVLGEPMLIMGDQPDCEVITLGEINSK